MASTGFAIVVSVPEPKDDAFIAKPFSPQFDALSQAIQRAVNSVGLTPRLLDLNPRSDRFLDAITQHTREARLLIAICSPEGNTSVPNPNVMYELGLAHAIAKPTIILTNDPDSLPANLRGYDVLEYADGDVQTSDFVNRLVVRIQRVEMRIGGDVIDRASHHGVSVARARHRLLLNPTSWDNFVEVLSFAKDVRHYFQDLHAGHVESLYEAVDEAVDQPTVSGRAQTEISRQWGDYELRYHYIYGMFVHDARAGLDRALKATEALREMSDEESKPFIVNTLAFLQQIGLDLSNYTSTHGEIVAMHRDRAFHTLLADPRLLNNLWGSLSHLSLIGHGLVTNADTVTVNLVGMISGKR